MARGKRVKSFVEKEGEFFVLFRVCAVTSLLGYYCVAIGFSLIFVGIATCFIVNA